MNNLILFYLQADSIKSVKLVELLKLIKWYPKNSSLFSIVPVTELSKTSLIKDVSSIKDIRKSFSEVKK